jgi:methionyl aminopeptidase
MIFRKGKSDLERMLKANQIVGSVLARLGSLVRPGISTLELDQVAEDMIRTAGGIPAFKGYRNPQARTPYPATLCTSVNDEIVHGIPRSDKLLKEGDILAIDVGVRYEGFYGDAAWTFPVGRISPEAQKLLEVTRQALYLGIDRARVGNRVSDISAAIQSHVESHGFSVVRDFVGHGIGRSLHEEPAIPNFGAPGRGPRLRNGMVLAIEPMVNSGGPGSRVLDDYWTAVTTDGGFSAHFEHSVAVTDAGPWVLSEWN